jgi:preprotein translocase subunit SecE
MAAPSTPQRNPFRRIAHFGQETMEELRKASWPTWLDLRDSTILVILTVFIVGSLVAVADFCFLQDVKAISHLASGR